MRCARGRVFLLVFAFLLVAGVVVWRRTTGSHFHQAVTPATEAPPDPRPLRRAILRLRADRDRNSALAVRCHLRTLACAGDCDTLGDLLKRPSGNQMFQPLLKAENAAFVCDAGLAAAIDDLLGATEEPIR